MTNENPVNPNPVVPQGAPVKYCAACGTQLHILAELCPKCGVWQAPLPNAAPQNPPSSSASAGTAASRGGRAKRSHPLVVAGAILLVVAVLWGIASHRAPKDKLTAQQREAIAENVVRLLAASIVPLEEQMEAAARSAGKGKYKVANPPVIDLLGHDAKESYMMTLNAGVQYRIVGRCESCGDLRLNVSDANGAVVSRNTDGDKTPDVDVKPKQTGQYRLDVHMRSCNDAPCRYGFTVLTK